MTENPVSLIGKIKRLEGLIDTNEITEWENKFLSDVVPTALARAHVGQVMGLTSKQLDTINQLFSKHYSA